MHFNFHNFNFIHTDWRILLKFKISNIFLQLPVKVRKEKRQTWKSLKRIEEEIFKFKQTLNIKQFDSFSVNDQSKPFDLFRLQHFKVSLKKQHPEFWQSTRK